MFKKSILLFVSFIIGFISFAAPTVTDVVVKQRYPWNGLVDITCKVSGLNDLEYKFKVEAIFPNSSETQKVQTVWFVRNGAKSDNLVVNADEIYHLLWDAKADLGEVRYTNMVVRVNIDRAMVQLWDGGPYWAAKNIGAEKPEDYGYYFWWGDTVGYKRENDKWVASDGSNSNFSFESSNTPTYIKSVATLKNEGWITSEGVFAPAHDAAHIHWGCDWRMPTKQEFDYLNNKCDWIWTTTNGVKGYVVSGRGDYASNSIFLPCAGFSSGTSLCYAGSHGYYWSSVPNSYDDSYAWYLDFHSGNHSTYNDYRGFGRSVRPVQDASLGSEGNAIISGESSPISLDTASLFITAPITYNASWVGNNSDATVVITDNGAEIYRGSGEGVLEWEPESYGKHELTYTTYINGVAQEEILSATLYKRAEIKNVVAKQRFPWNGKIDINFEVRGDVTIELPNWYTAELSVIAKDSVTGEEWIAKTLTGDTGIEEGEHHVVWDMKADGLSFYLTNIKFKVVYSRKLDVSKKYYVIDLSVGKDALKYPVTYLDDVPVGGWTDEHKTTKLVLRLIEPGSFKMGGSYDVTLTKPYYMGVFEVTQKQYELVTGNKPSNLSGDTLPVERVSWDMIRGNSSTHNWPTVKTVDSNSFVGRIQGRTGLNFDLPTEAQWEYACCAGTTTTYYWGNSMDGTYAWYSGNSSSKTHIVGTRTPNDWGLYDMSGNVREWCLDWYAGLSLSENLEGPLSGSYRVGHGGGWASSASACTSAFRIDIDPSSVNSINGFRLALHLGK